MDEQERSLSTWGAPISKGSENAHLEVTTGPTQTLLTLQHQQGCQFSVKHLLAHCRDWPHQSLLDSPCELLKAPLLGQDPFIPPQPDTRTSDNLRHMTPGLLESTLVSQVPQTTNTYQ